jgi:hypothetical protein
VVDRAWRKHDGKSRRVLRLLLKNGVDRVDGVDPETASDYTDNTVYTDTDPEGARKQFVEDHSLRWEELAIECGHGYPRGKGCYLCDPSHPYRLEQGGVA